MEDGKSYRLRPGDWLNTVTGEISTPERNPDRVAYLNELARRQRMGDITEAEVLPGVKEVERRPFPMPRPVATPKYPTPTEQPANPPPLDYVPAKAQAVQLAKLERAITTETPLGRIADMIVNLRFDDGRTFGRGIKAQRSGGQPPGGQEVDLRMEGLAEMAEMHAWAVEFIKAEKERAAEKKEQNNEQRSTAGNPA